MEGEKKKKRGCKRAIAALAAKEGGGGSMTIEVSFYFYFYLRMHNQNDEPRRVLFTGTTRLAVHLT